MTYIQLQTFFMVITLFSFCYSQNDQYNCVDLENISQPKVFKSLEDYKHSHFPIKTENNWIAFSENIHHLEADSLVAKDSNFIRRLYLSEKGIEKIDEGAFKELYCVTSLFLQNNQLTDLYGDQFIGLNELTELNLSHNKLSSIPAHTFTRIDGLTKLDLSHNEIKKFSTDTFSSLENLVELHLEHNYLSDLPSNMFEKLHSLRSLYLGSNRMSVITTPSLRFLEELHFLDLSNNGIGYIYVQMFHALDKVYILDLSANNMKRLDMLDLHLNMPMLRKLGLKDNPWQCSELEKTVKQMESFGIGVMLNNNKTTFTDIDIYEIGCFGDSGLITTSSSNDIPMPVLPDNENILLAIENLKSYVIALIVIIVICTAIVVIYRTNSFSIFTRRRGVLTFQDNEEDPSLPLLSR